MADESGTREQLRENWRGLQAEVESLREQLKVATELGPLYRKWQEAEVRAEAAEAKLAEVQADSALRSETIAGLRAKLAEVEKGLDAALERVEDERARVMAVEKERDEANLCADEHLRERDEARASMDRARELAEEPNEFTNPHQRTGEAMRRLAEIARLLAANEEKQKYVQLPDGEWIEDDAPK